MVDVTPLFVFVVDGGFENLLRLVVHVMVSPETCGAARSYRIICGVSMFAERIRTTSFRYPRRATYQVAEGRAHRRITWVRHLLRQEALLSPETLEFAEVLGP